MDDEWQAQFDYNATTSLPEYQISCWTKKGFEERFAFFPTLLEQTEKVRTVLDVGCGPGPYCRFLSAKGYKVTGVDYAPHVISLAQERHPQGTYLVANGYDLPFPDQSFDLVISIGVLQCLEHEDRFIAELTRVAKRYVIMSTLRRAHRRADPRAALRKELERDAMPARDYHPDELTPFFTKAGFLSSVHAYEGEALTDCFFILARRKP